MALKNFKKRANAMKQEGMNWVPAWKDLARLNNPTRGYFDDVRPNKGQKINHVALLDSHAEHAIQASASGMLSGFSSSARPWFEIETPDPDLNKFAPVKLQLDEMARRMLQVMATSNIYEIYASDYEELLSFGTACSTIEVDFQDVIRGRSYTIGEYYLSFDGKGRWNGFYRKVWMTVGQVVKEFGIENVGPTVAQAYRANNVGLWIKVSHLVEENDERDPNKIDNLNMPYRSIYWEEGSSNPDKMLRQSGFEEQSIFAPRWHTTVSSDVYGRGPGWKILGDNKMLQKEVSERALASEKANNPPMQSDASVDGEVNTLPGGHTRFSALLPNAGLKPAYQVSPDTKAVTETILELRKKISEQVFAELFRTVLDVDRAQTTATEIAERKAESLDLIAPFSTKLNNDYHNPGISRIANIMIRAGMFPDFPPEMAGMDLRIKYISTMAQAQRMIGIVQLENEMAFAGQLGQMNSSVWDNINFDETLRTHHDMSGIPEKVLNSPEQVAAKRKQDAAIAQQRATAERIALAADAAAKGGNAVESMSKAELDKNSALDGLLDVAKEANPQ